MPHRCGIYNVFILRMNENFNYMVGISQSHICKCFSAVGALINSVPRISRACVVGIPCADPNDVRVGWRNCYISDCIGAVLIKDGIESGSVINCFEHAAVAGGDKIGVFIFCPGVIGYCNSPYPGANPVGG